MMCHTIYFSRNKKSELFLRPPVVDGRDQIRGGERRQENPKGSNTFFRWSRVKQYTHPPPHTVVVSVGRDNSGLVLNRIWGGSSVEEKTFFPTLSHLYLLHRQYPPPMPLVVCQGGSPSTVSNKVKWGSCRGGSSSKSTSCVLGGPPPRTFMAGDLGLSLREKLRPRLRGRRPPRLVSVGSRESRESLAESTSHTGAGSSTRRVFQGIGY